MQITNFNYNYSLRYHFINFFNLLQFDIGFFNVKDDKYKCQRCNLILFILLFRKSCEGGEQ